MAGLTSGTLDGDCKRRANPLDANLFMSGPTVLALLFRAWPGCRVAGRSECGPDVVQIWGGVTSGRARRAQSRFTACDGDVKQAPCHADHPSSRAADARSGGGRETVPGSSRDVVTGPGWKCSAWKECSAGKDNVPGMRVFRGWVGARWEGRGAQGVPVASRSRCVGEGRGGTDA